jgi:hypothetical protein
MKEMGRLAAQHRIHFVDHGPKFGLEVIEKPGRENARPLAYNVALDIVPWEQYACLSPRVVFVQDGEVSAELSPNSWPSREWEARPPVLSAQPAECQTAPGPDPAPGR